MAIDGHGEIAYRKPGLTKSCSATDDDDMSRCVHSGCDTYRQQRTKFIYESFEVETLCFQLQEF